MPYSAESYEYLFDQCYEHGLQSAFEALAHRDVFRYRAKTIKAGDVLECEIYPIWNTQNEIRKAASRASSDAQVKLNAKNARKTLVRKINANFTEEDLCVTLTYKGEAPDEEQARKDIRNYMRRIRDHRKKHGLPALRYIYVIEFVEAIAFEAMAAQKKRIHHHVVMSGMDRDEAERLWGKGYANTRRLQPNEFGMEALARYMIKDPKGGKRWCGSKNLIDPKVTIADTKISKRQVEKLADDMTNFAPQIFAKLFPDYVFNDCTVSRSNFVAGAYVYARMHADALKARKGGTSNANRPIPDGSQVSNHSRRSAVALRR